MSIIREIFQCKFALQTESVSGVTYFKWRLSLQTWKKSLFCNLLAADLGTASDVWHVYYTRTLECFLRRGTRTAQEFIAPPVKVRRSMSKMYKWIFSAKPCTQPLNTFDGVPIGRLRQSWQKFSGSSSLIIWIGGWSATSLNINDVSQMVAVMKWAVIYCQSNSLVTKLIWLLDSLLLLYTATVNNGAGRLSAFNQSGHVSAL